MLFAGIGVVLDGPLILFFEGRTPHFRAWAFLRRGCDRTKGIPKTIGFWRRSFPPFLSLLKEMGPPEAQRESVQRAAAAKSDPRP